MNTCVTDESFVREFDHGLCIWEILAGMGVYQSSFQLEIQLNYF